VSGLIEHFQPISERKNSTIKYTYLSCTDTVYSFTGAEYIFNNKLQRSDVNSGKYFCAFLCEDCTGTSFAGPGCLSCVRIFSIQDHKSRIQQTTILNENSMQFNLTQANQKVAVNLTKLKII
jgi:hypothetical protein